MGIVISDSPASLKGARDKGKGDKYPKWEHVCKGTTVGRSTECLDNEERAHVGLGTESRRSMGQDQTGEQPRMRACGASWPIIRVLSSKNMQNPSGF